MARLKGTERKEQLLEVATKLFAERGFDATTTAAIAEAAGITEPVLYRHFENKKDLFIAVLRQCTNMLIGLWQEAINSAPRASEQIRQMAQSVSSADPEIREAQRVIYGAMATTCDPDVRNVISEHGAKFREISLQIVRLGQQQGEFRDDLEQQAMAWSLVNLYTGFSFSRLRLAGEHLDIRVGVELAINGICKDRRA